MDKRPFERIEIIRKLEGYNEGYLRSKIITMDEFKKNHRVLISLIVNNILLTENQVKSVRGIPELARNIIRFRAFITLIQMCSN